MGDKMPSPQSYEKDEIDLKKDPVSDYNQHSNPEWRQLDKLRGQDGLSGDKSAETVINVTVEALSDEESAKLKKDLEAVKNISESPVPSVDEVNPETVYAENKKAYDDAFEEWKANPTDSSKTGEYIKAKQDLEKAAMMRDSYRLQSRPADFHPAVKAEASVPAEKKETPDYMSVGSFDELFEKMRGYGRSEAEIEALKNFRAEFKKHHTGKEAITVNSSIFSAFTREGGFRLKVYDLLMQDTAGRDDESPEPAPEGPKSPGPLTAEANPPVDLKITKSEPQPKAEEVPEYLPEEQEYNAGADNSEDVPFRELEDISIEGVDGVGSFEELYSLLRSVKNIEGINKYKYSAEDIIKRIEAARVISKDRGTVDWLGVADVTAGPDKGGEDDLQRKTAELLRKELNLNAEESATPEEDEDVKTADVDAVKESPEENTATEAGPETQAESPENRMAEWKKYVKIRAGLLAEDTIEILGNLYERSDFANMVDRTRALYNDRFAEKYEKKAAKLKGKMDEQLKKAESLNVALKYENNPGRKHYLEGLMAARTEKAKAYEERLNKQNSIRAEFEEKRNASCQKVVGRLEMRLEPHDLKLNELKDDKKELEDVIGQMKAKITERENERKELAAVKASLPFIARFSVSFRIREMDSDIKKWEKEIGKIRKAQAKLDAKIAKAEKKSKPLRDRKTEIEDIMKRRQAAPVITETAGAQESTGGSGGSQGRRRFNKRRKY